MIPHAVDIDLRDTAAPKPRKVYDDDAHHGVDCPSTTEADVANNLSQV